MVDISIFDKNFVGDACSCHGQSGSKYIKWDRPSSNQSVRDIAFFTDLCIDMALQVISKRKVAWLMEPRPFQPSLYDKVLSMRKQFDYILTYDDYLLQHGGNFLFCPWGSSWVGTRDNLSLVKSKNVSIIASNKMILEGHQLRHKVVQQCVGVDAYGYTYQSLPKAADGKKVALDDYRFSVTIENCRINNFFTEKLIDCFMCKCIPIYWGAKNIDQFFNPEGIIQFNDLTDLKGILTECVPQNYERRLKAVEENYRIAHSYLIGEDWLFENYPFLFKLGI